jgi:hypothetical protein
MKVMLGRWKIPVVFFTQSRLFSDVKTLEHELKCNITYGK